MPRSSLEAVKAWDAQVASTTALVDLACRLAEFDGVEPAEPPDADARATRAAELVADLAEPAKVSALEKLGEGARALGIATGWLRTRLLVDDRSINPDPAAEGEGASQAPIYGDGLGLGRHGGHGGRGQPLPKAIA